MHFNFIRSNLAPFGLFLLGLIWSYSVHSIHFGPIRSILFTLVLFGPLWPYSAHIGFIRFTLVLFCPFVFIQSNLVLFGLFGFIQFYSLQFSLIRSYSVHFGYLVLFGLSWSNLVHTHTHIYIYIYTDTQRAGSRPRQVRPRPKAPPKNKNFLGKKGPTFHS